MPATTRGVRRMRSSERDITRRFLDELIRLLDEERETRERPRRPELAAAIGNLRIAAFDNGASERTVGLIQAAEVMVALHAMPVGPGAPH